MTEHDLQRVLRLAAAHPLKPEPGPETDAGVDFADSILARLPVVRFVIPGSAPGRRILWLAGLLGVLTAAAVGIFKDVDPPGTPVPPSLSLFQPAELEYHPAGGSK